MKHKKSNYQIYIFISCIVFLFSIFAPYLFSQLSWGIEFNSDSASIGDTIGGITAPFMSLIGSILVFAALKAQNEANELVLRQLDKQETDLKLEAINKIEILQIDLESIIEDIKLRGTIIKKYYEEERTAPFEMHVLKRTSSRVYSRILELERESIYKGFKQFKSDRNQWIKEYNKLYLIFDYLPDFFEGIYSMSDKHVKEAFDSKMAIRNRLIELTKLAIRFNEDYKKRYPMLNISASKLYQANQNVVFEYQAVIDESYDEKGNLVSETNLKKMSEEVLLNFINRILEIKKNHAHQYDPSIMPLMEIASEIRREIELLFQRAIEVSNNIEIEYSKLVIEDNSVLIELEKLKSFIENELSIINSI